MNHHKYRNTKGIVAVGCIVTDVCYTIDKYPRKGNLTKIYKPFLSTGGLSNIVIDLARLDKNLPITVGGVIGTDEHGDFILEKLGQYPNVNLNNIIRRGRTSTSYVMTEACSKERTFFYDSVGNDELSPKDIDFSALKGDFFILEYLLSLDALDAFDTEYGTKSAYVLNQAQKAGMKTFVDVISEEKKERYKTAVIPTLKYVDYFTCNEIEAGSIVGTKHHDDAGIDDNNMFATLEKIRTFGVSEWIVIHAPSCAFGLNCKTGETFKKPSASLPKDYIKGTIGAGDAFAAGVVYAAYKGLDLETAMIAGIQCAARALGQIDNNLGVIPFEQMMVEQL
ncbi:MAG: carbohydrate kinase family protein [Lachnospiraceae bacterium]|nr:carbohydrate kinase family protein [Lachnospiraceae bacterium]